MVRSILAVISGIVTWMIVATLINFLIRALLPGYVAAEPTLHFTLAMMLARLALAVVTSIVAGFVTAAVARGRMLAVYICAALILLFFLPIHYKLWSILPVWYHAFFLLTLAPLILLGALIQRRRGQPTAAVA